MRMRVERVSRVNGTAEIVGASCVATSAAQKFKHRDLVCINVCRVVARDHRGEGISTAWLQRLWLPRLPASQCGCMLYPEAMLRLRLRYAGHMCATDRIQF
jgi:hypothetical protein